MEKYFIEAAFKSLDEIYKEENANIKRALKESREKEKLKRDAGIPEIGIKAFNHATDIGSKNSSDSLSEDVKENSRTKFNLKDEEQVKEAIKAKENSSDETKDLVIVHPLLKHKLPEPGDAIITCKNCMEVFYIDKNNLSPDKDDPNTFNKDIKCENCGAENGYAYKGDVSKPETKSALEAQEERNELDNDGFFEEDKDSTNDEEPEEFLEESFDKLINKYAKNIYENLDNYKTTSIKYPKPNTYLIEGVLKLKKGKESNTSFLLEAVKKENNNILFKGNNKDLIEDEDPFVLEACVKDKKLMVESLGYSYTENINSEDYLVEGFESNK